MFLSLGCQRSITGLRAKRFHENIKTILLFDTIRRSKGKLNFSSSYFRFLVLRRENIYTESRINLFVKQLLQNLFNNKK